MPIYDDDYGQDLDISRDGQYINENEAAIEEIKQLDNLFNN
jgi:hypothetical protein